MLSLRSFDHPYGTFTAKTAYYNYPYALRLRQCYRENHPVMLMTDKLLELKQNEITTFVESIIDKNDHATLRAACSHLSDVTNALKAEIRASEANGAYMVAMTMRLDAPLLSELIQAINNAIKEISTNHCDHSRTKKP